jgi:HD-like signal output (HDOD) protein
MAAQASLSVRRPSSTAQTAVESFASQVCAVRPFPAVVSRIHAIAAKSGSSMNEIANVVESDVAFAARVLTVVNSAAMGLVRPCATIRHATTLLGTRGIANVATAVAALVVVDDASAPEVAKHARTTAGIARILAPLCGMPADEAFTAALLHDIGLLMLLQSRDPLYEELVDQMGPGAEPSLADERALLGFDHAELGSHVLRRWNVPDPLPESVALHHDIDAAIRVGGHVATLTGIVHLADVLALRVAERCEPDESDDLLLREDRAVAFLKLAPEDLLARWSTFRDAGDGWGEHPSASDDETMTRRPTPASPSPVPRAPTTEAVRARSARTPLLAAGITLALAASGAIAFFAMR